MIQTIVRKLADTRKRLKKLPQIVSFNESEFSKNRPVLLNSIPKSGTHLLYQVLETFPLLIDKGEFIANIPSRPYKFRSQNTINNRIKLITPGELIRSHLFYSKESYEKLSERKVIKYFIYRDPRDISISEAMYLAKMNKWHEMSKYFQGLNDYDRITLAIKGHDSKIDYPNIEKRINWYKGWLSTDGVFTIKFEDLVDNKRRNHLINEMILHYQNLSNIDFNVAEVQKKALRNIIPEKSHTFRKGNKKNWQKVFSMEHISLFKEIAGELLIDLGYETNLDW